MPFLPKATVSKSTLPPYLFCFEMDKYYLFGKEELVNLFSVNKDNGDVRVFNPIYDCTSIEFAKKTVIKDFR